MTCSLFSNQSTTLEFANMTRAKGHMIICHRKWLVNVLCKIPGPRHCSRRCERGGTGAPRRCACTADSARAHRRQPRHICAAHGGQRAPVRHSGCCLQFAWHERRARYHTPVLLRVLHGRHEVSFNALFLPTCWHNAGASLAHC